VKSNYDLDKKKRALLEQLLAKDGLDNASSAIEHIPHNGVTPMSPAQVRIWFLNQLQPESPVYNFSAALRMKGTLSFDVLQNSLRQVFARHDVLRASFELGQHEPEQIIHPSLEPAIAVKDYSGEKSVAAESRAYAFAEEVLLQPFSLQSAPLVRFYLLKIADDDQILLGIFHHIIAELWSATILFSELAKFYTAEINGLEARLPELQIQYSDYAAWSQRQISSHKYDDQISFWRQTLKKHPSHLHLPTDKPRPAVQSLRGAWKSAQLAPSLLTDLKALARQAGTTVATVLLACFKVLLSRYSGQYDILVGSPVAGRGRTETEGLIGLFINTVVLRSHVQPSQTFMDFLRTVRENSLNAYSNQDVPFEKLVEELKPDREAGHTPLFQVMFAAQKAPEVEIKFAGIDNVRLLGSAEIHNRSSKMDLAFFVEETEVLEVGCEYSSDLFEEPTILALIESFECIVKQVVNTPEIRLQNIDITPLKQKSVMAAWNANDGAFDRSTPVYQLFERMAQSSPNAVAVVEQKQELRYSELNCRANQLARRLQTQGVKPGSIVGVCVERSIDFVIGILAVLKTGAAYLPLDPAYPEERLSFMLKDAGVSVLLTHRSLGRKTSLADAHFSVLHLDGDPALVKTQSKENLLANTQPDDLAYVIYTSGSTGRPKGVCISHSALLNLVYWHNKDFSVTANDHATSVAGLAFDASVWEIWPYLSVGATLYLAPDEVILSPVALQEWLSDNEISITFLPTPLAERVLGLDWPERVPLRILLTGGDKLHNFPDKQLPFELINNYGPTENAVVATSGKIPDSVKFTEVPPCIGRPIDNTQVYILDENLMQTPVGVPGEMYIGGKSLAQGYLNRADLTAERFSPNPFAQGTGCRMYKTGDLVRYMSNGDIEFLGRLDDQVKVRGFRIELGEVEAALGQHESVSEVICQIRQDSGNTNRLVAYIVPVAGSNVDEVALKGMLAKKLPDYMIPANIVFLDRLPLTANGKIDRDALPTPDSVPLMTKKDYQAPTSTIQKQLASIWKEKLSIERVGLNDNFFELGGHSLLLIEVNTWLKSNFNKDISMMDMFKYPTIKALSEFLTDSKPESEETTDSRGKTRKDFMKRRAASRSKR